MLGRGWSREGARAGGGTRVVEGGSWYARGRSGGWPGRFLRIGTLVVRRTGSSLLVVVEGDGGGGLREAPVRGHCLLMARRRELGETETIQNSYRCEPLRVPDDCPH